jgi:ribulose-phosphate 3-epimerase
MSYQAGHGGQEMNNEIFNKIRELKSEKDQNNWGFSIFVDGGITLENIKQIKLSGVNEVCVGERLIEGNIEENFEKYLKAMY